jgi:hypothetical protein
MKINHNKELHLQNLNPDIGIQVTKGTQGLKFLNTAQILKHLFKNNMRSARIYLHFFFCNIKSLLKIQN